jgi:hypothetical protein
MSCSDHFIAPVIAQSPGVCGQSGEGLGEGDVGEDLRGLELTGYCWSGLG